MERSKLKVKAILFDLDGTILDSKEAYHEAMRAAFKEMGKEKFDPKLIREIPRKLEQGLPINDMIKGIDPQRFLNLYLKAYYRLTATKARPIPNVSATLKRLSKVAKLAITTMRYVPKENVIEELKRFGLSRYFQHVITAIDTSNPKPSPEALIRCAREFGFETSECAVVGDSIVDVRAGKNAGARTVAVLSGIFSREELERENPDLILESVRELPDFVE
jgi:HAD superfamily hydrolase (TIGR01509 family)